MLGRSPGEGNSYPLQYYCLENPTDSGAWRDTVHGVAKESDASEQLSELLTFSNKPAVSPVLQQASQVLQQASQVVLVVNNPPANAVDARDAGAVSITGLERSLEKENGKPFQYLCLKNSMGKRSLVGYSPWTVKELDVTEHIHTTVSQGC